MASVLLCPAGGVDERAAAAASRPLAAPCPAFAIAPSSAPTAPVHAVAADSALHASRCASSPSRCTVSSSLTPTVAQACCGCPASHEQPLGDMNDRPTPPLTPLPQIVTAAGVAPPCSSSSAVPSAPVSCRLPCPRLRPSHCCGRCSTPRRRWLLSWVVLLCLLLLGAGVSVGVLYPRPPSVVAHSLRLLQLSVDLSPSDSSSAAVADSNTSTASTAPAVNVSALLSVSFTLHNPNAYSAHHSASLVSFRSVGSSALLTGHLTLPAGFIASRGSEDVSSTVSVLTSLSSPSQLQQWQGGGMQVAAVADTSGYVDFLFGLHVPYTVHTQCSATLTLDMQHSTVDVSGQQCSNGL